MAYKELCKHTAGVSGHLGLYMIQAKEPLESKFRTKLAIFKAATGANFVYLPDPSEAMWAVFLLCVHNRKILSQWYMQQIPSHFGKWRSTAIRPSLSEKNPWITHEIFSSLNFHYKRNLKTLFSLYLTTWLQFTTYHTLGQKIYSWQMGRL